jgi:hypothetical protein
MGKKEEKLNKKRSPYIVYNQKSAVEKKIVLKTSFKSISDSEREYYLS